MLNTQKDFWSNVSDVMEVSIIPDNTFTAARVEAIEYKTFEKHSDKKDEEPKIDCFGDYVESDVEPQTETLINVMWKIVDGEFKGKCVFQKIRIFDENANKAIRAKSMLMRLYNLNGLLLPKEKPTDEELKSIIGQIYAIRIQVWSLGGNTGNWVSEIHANK